MAKRKAISKKQRFEVFKRDSFTCQYCGRQAPDVVLQVDHIHPVAEGGTNDIMNLITSCTDCNQGKGKVLLSDKQVIEKQKKQLDELNERREQLEMILQWKNELSEFEDEAVESIINLIDDLAGFDLSQEKVRKIRSLIKEFGYAEVYESTEIAFVKLGLMGYETRPDCFNKIGGICYNRKKNKLSSERG
jgi:hypothetical protein